MNTTIRLFDEDAYIREFEARVTDVRIDRDRAEISLDRTAFYPRGGGQPGDTGTLGIFLQDAPCTFMIRDTYEKDGIIWHMIDFSEQPDRARTEGQISGIRAGDKVDGKLDWERRFSLMQLHSGEHIVSGIIHSLYGCDNVGFHMGSDMITIDFNRELTSEELRIVEEKANKLIWTDIRTQIHVYDGQDAVKIAYRSKKDIEGNIRIVVFPGADACACCGTHVAGTGEIGLVKIIGCERFKSGVRVQMVAGSLAMAYLSQIHDQNHAVSVLLSAPPAKTAEAVGKMKDTQDKLRYRVFELEKAYYKLFAQNIAGEADRLVFMTEGDMENARRLADEMMHVCSGLCAVFAGTDDTGYVYAVAREGRDLRDLVRRMNQALNGRGGGKPHFAQGRVAASGKDIKGFFEDEGMILAPVNFQ